eukprot:TRINITY_DN4979_c0_g1_i6.p1 TRINITY_DN4979_c0_g1~~TRINITY_DN4979_c0_g1_i6.p1  ORF type:complete len:697 (-),score=36.65 TRINITY_DN4979_c0_g1_i6:131-2221(-)
MVYLDNKQCFFSFCTGVKIAPDVVLTAAHCMQYPIESIVVTQTKCRHILGREALGVKHVFVHPEFDIINKYNDIAVVQLNESFYHYSSISYNAEYEVNVSDNFQIMGYGKANIDVYLQNKTGIEDPVVSESMHMGYYEYISEERCKEVMSGEPYNYAYADKINYTLQGCVYSQSVDTCVGDSGAPVVFRSANYPHTVLVGLNSFGPGRDKCISIDGPQAPGVFVRIAGVQQWIDEIMMNITCVDKEPTKQQCFVGYYRGVCYVLSNSTRYTKCADFCQYCYGTLSSQERSLYTLAEQMYGQDPWWSTGWFMGEDAGDPCQKWEDIYCTDGKVTRIDIMQQSVPSQISQLSTLEIITLQDVGAIPEQISTLSNLVRVDILKGRSSGTLPAQLSSLNKLIELRIDDNNLEGTIPVELSAMTSLEMLGLSYNGNVTGQIPMQFSRLSRLKYISFVSTGINGTIPQQLSEMNQLEHIFLTNNNLSGTIPPQFSTLTNLQGLHLDNNALSGTIPPQFSTLINLQYLYLQNSDFSGTIPPQFSTLTNLNYLYLQNNTMVGTMPPQFSKLSNLNSLRLENNTLVGTIPPQFSKLSNLYYLRLENNTLVGSIPKELSTLSSLYEFSITNNLISGTIPRELSTWPGNVIYMDNNQISGTISVELSNWGGRYVHLSNNSITGTVPPDVSNWAASSVILDNNNLAGT